MIAADPRAYEAALEAGVLWALDRERVGDGAQRGGRGRLAGLPVAVKDVFAVAGLPRTLGLARRTTSAEDAELVARLRRAGALVVGTTAMDQLGWTMSGRSPGTPALENPVAPGRSTGGSSGGSAAAVGAGLVALALGSDTAGSVRVPAAWCGVTGFKPTSGLLPLGGCAPLAPRFDTAGILARELPLVAAVLEVLAGVAAEAPRIPPRLGIPAALVDAAGLDAEVAAAWAAVRKRLAGGAREVDGTFGASGMGTILASELAARWGDAVDAEDPERIAPEVRSGIEHGRTIDAVAYVRAADRVAAAARGPRRSSTRWTRWCCRPVRSSRRRAGTPRPWPCAAP